MNFSIPAFACASALLVVLPATAQEHAAKALMQSAEGKDLGTVTFEQTKSGMLRIFVEMTGLPPGPHGFHIHEKGQCDAAGGFESAGGHLAGGREHGFNTEKGPHIGDLPNVHVAADGILKVEFFTDRLTLEEGAENSLRRPDGAAVVVHADPDDYSEQPAGHAGARIACGVIE